MSLLLRNYHQYELSQWEHAIAFKLKELNSLRIALAEFTKQETRTMPANQAESYKTLLNRMASTIKAFHLKIIKQQQKLKAIKNAGIDIMHINEIEKMQSELRDNMEPTEKKYDEIKFNTYRFLSAFVKNTENTMIDAAQIQ